MTKLLGKCGCNCGACPAYKANAKTEEDRQRCSEGWAKYLGARLKPDSISCAGCQAPAPWETGNLLPDRSCNIRPCAIHASILNCAYCSHSPCPALIARIPDGDFREKTERRIGAPITEEDYIAFLQPYEGLKNLREIRRTLNKEQIVDPPEVKPIRARLAKFPENLPFSKADITGFKALHDLITKIQTAHGETYAHQLVLKRRRAHVLSMLWVMGLYGDFDKEGSQLILDGEFCGNRPECSWFVRKYDNTFYYFARQGASILSDYGANLQLEQKNKYWLLKLKFGKKAGGKAALKALKTYTTKLAEKYGEPVYGGSSRLKGEAITLFAKGDLGVLL